MTTNENRIALALAAGTTAAFATWFLAKQENRDALKAAGTEVAKKVEEVSPIALSAALPLVLGLGLVPNVTVQENEGSDSNNGFGFVGTAEHINAIKAAFIADPAAFLKVAESPEGLEGLLNKLGLAVVKEEAQS